MFLRKPTSHFQSRKGLFEQDSAGFLPSKKVVLVEPSSMERVGACLPVGRESNQTQQKTSVYKGDLSLERVGGIEPPTKPWEGLVLPLNHTRQRSAVYAFLVVLASMFFILQPVRAQEVVPVTPYHFNENLIASGWTLRLVDGANLTVFPGVLPVASDVLWAPTTDVIPTLPDGAKQLGSAYRLTVTGATTLYTAKWKLAAAVPNPNSTWSKNIWVYDIAAKTWTKSSTKLNPTTNKLQGGVVSLDAYVVVLEDQHAQEGIASYYGTYKKTTKLTYVAASNTFPKGTKLRVTNLENNKTVDIVVVDTGAFKNPRVIDLSTPAFEKIQAKWKGLAKVRVELITASTPPAPTPAVVTNESLPTYKVSAASVSQAPKVTASSYHILDAATGQVLAEKNSSTSVPIASLTKLMTAMVVLDAGVDMNKVMTYSKTDVTPYAYLRIKTGETLTVKDLFYSMIVGSANNASTTLARSTGMTRAQFISAMNVKAQALGLTGTSFADTSGLDPKNVSTAADMAIIANHAFHNYPLLRKASTVTVYTFKTKNTKISHTIKTTDKLLTQKNGLTITGGKTGFLDEAKYTYVLRVKNAKGAQVVVALLGSSTSTTRFNEAANLASWAWKNFTWS